ncbi:hypothetical protein K2X30_00210 [bacterium]|jgi:hypothetical protein|nr:hypothetical protein [bacterium]
MTRIILRWLNAPIFVLMVVVGLALQSSLFSFYPLLYLQPDLLLIVAVWCGLRRPFIEGGVIVLLVSALGEVHGGAPQGLFEIAYMCVYLLVRLLAKVIVVGNFGSVIALTLGSSILWKLICLLFLYLMGKADNQWKHTVSLIFPSAVITGTFSVWVYRWLEWFDWKTYKSPRAQQLLEDELLIEGEGF